MLPEYLSSEGALDSFLTGFEDGTYPKIQWTHGAHVAMASSYILILAEEELLDRTRERIRHYNMCQGGQNTEEAGYHETLTVFWLAVLRNHIDKNCEGLGRLETVRSAFAEFSSRGGLWREYYSFDVIQSREARKIWIAPDLQPMN